MTGCCSTLVKMESHGRITTSTLDSFLSRLNTSIQSTRSCFRMPTFVLKSSFERRRASPKLWKHTWHRPWNIITGDDAELRLSFLKRLAVISKSLGSKKEPVWMELPVPNVRDNEGARLKILEMRRMFARLINKKESEPDADNEFRKLYNCLGVFSLKSIACLCIDLLRGGSKQTLLTDVEQARLMWKLRVKIDFWSQGVKESIRQRNRLLLLDLYLQLPPRRIWLYAKQVRVAHFPQLAGSNGQLIYENYLPQSEDIIVQRKYPYLNQEISIDWSKASNIIRPDRLGQLIYKAAMNSICIKQRSEVDLWGKIDKLDLQSREQLILLDLLNSDHPRKLPQPTRSHAITSCLTLKKGSIRDCGKLIWRLRTLLERWYPSRYRTNRETCKKIQRH